MMMPDYHSTFCCAGLLQGPLHWMGWFLHLWLFALFRALLLCGPRCSPASPFACICCPSLQFGRLMTSFRTLIQFHNIEENAKTNNLHTVQKKHGKQFACHIVGIVSSNHMLTCFLVRSSDDKVSLATLHLTS